MDGLIVVAVFVILVVVTIALGVRIVPQGSKQVVQRLGKYHKTLGPGLNIIFPYIDRVANKVTTKDIVLDIPSQEVITKDNAVIIANAVAYINIISPEKSVYGVEDYRLAIQNLVQTSLRSIIGEMDLDDALSSRDEIKARLKTAISDDIADWGITIKTVEIQDINPSETMQKAMEEQAAAERERRATVTRADGEKAAAILEAEGRLEASKRDAQAKVVLAEASQRAIQKVTDAIKDKELPVMFLLGEKYIEALRNLSNSDNSKVIVLPGDIPAAVRGIISAVGK
ncbi:MAG: SPFH domain-containing protein [Desulfobacterales bacterium]|jgi:regulator of protease activity HflC (stomatin/prohibitin superfamily)